MQQRNPDSFNAGSNPQTSDKDFISSLLYTLALVESPIEEAADKFTCLVTRALDVPVALVSFFEEERDRQIFKSQIGLVPEWAEQGETPLSHSFCQYVKQDNRALLIEDAPSDSRVCGNLAIPVTGGSFAQKQPQLRGHDVRPFDGVTIPFPNLTHFSLTQACFGREHDAARGVPRLFSPFFEHFC